MANNIRGWMMPAAWFVAGVFATGSFWYFLSQQNSIGTLLSAIGAIFFAGVAIYLHLQSGKSVLNAPHRRQLATFLSEAHRLRSRLNELPLPITEHNAWVSRVDCPPRLRHDELAHLTHEGGGRWPRNAWGNFQRPFGRWPWTG